MRVRLGQIIKEQTDFPSMKDYEDYRFLVSIMASLRLRREPEFGWDKIDSHCDSRCSLMIDRIRRTLPLIQFQIAVIVVDAGPDYCEAEKQDIVNYCFLHHDQLGHTYNYHMAPALQMREHGKVHIIDPAFFGDPQSIENWGKALKPNAGTIVKIGIVDEDQVEEFLGPYRSIYEKNPQERIITARHRLRL